MLCKCSQHVAYKPFGVLQVLKTQKMDTDILASVSFATSYCFAAVFRGIYNNEQYSVCQKTSDKSSQGWQIEPTRFDFILSNQRSVYRCLYFNFLFIQSALSKFEEKFEDKQNKEACRVVTFYSASDFCI